MDIMCLGRGVSPVSLLGAEIRASQILWHMLGDGESKQVILLRRCNADIVISKVV